MVLESTMVCVDNSEYMRNGDYIPTRLQAQQDAVNLICHSKTRSNPENNVGLLTLANTEVLVTLTSDVGRILSKLHQVQPNGLINLLSAIRIAHLALKHRQGKNHKMRIVVFIGSPVQSDEKELVKLAKRLKKEKVNVDIVNFGEDNVNSDVLTTFVSTINGKDGAGLPNSSHLVTVPPGPHLSEALLTSPIIQGEDGTGGIGLGSAAGFEFGVDPNEDPELALALRVSMEEQRQRQEEEARRASAQSAAEAGANVPAVITSEDGSSEEKLLEKALAMSLGEESQQVASEFPDFAAMTEDEQIAYAMKMSLQPTQAGVDKESKDAPVPMETDVGESPKRSDNDDYSEVMNDPAFLQSVLENLPGVDPQSEAIRSAVGTLSQQPKPKDKNEKSDQS